MVNAEAVSLRVEIKLPGSRVCPIKMGQEYSSPGTIVFVDKILFAFNADPPDETKFTENCTFDPPLFVALNVSMIVVQLTAVYCVVCADSAYLLEMSSLCVIVGIIKPPFHNNHTQYQFLVRLLLYWLPATNN